MSTSIQSVDEAPTPSASGTTGLLAWLSVVCGVGSVMLWLIAGIPFPAIAAIGVVAGWAALRRYERQADRRLAKAGAWIRTACLALVVLGLLTRVLIVSSLG